MYLTIPVSPEYEQILHYLGYRRGKTEISPDLSRQLKQSVREGLAWLQPRASISTGDLAFHQGKLFISEQAMTMDSRQIMELLKDCSQASLIGITAGADLEREIDHSFARGAYNRGTILDALGNAMMDRAVDWVREKVAALAKQAGFFITPSFGPGYAGWPLADQPKLWRLAQAADIGVSVTDSCQLIPRKSLLVLIGWTRKKMEESGCKCLSCTYHCQFRSSTLE